ncbi:MAG: PHP domain-containing protein, partial [Spirochaetales bacterium]|nr:PHP domain-containing protein [Spirochaetales bacterium]
MLNFQAGAGRLTGRLPATPLPASSLQAASPVSPILIPGPQVKASVYSQRRIYHPGTQTREVSGEVVDWGFIIHTAPMIDLHTHSRASDGSLNPEELIQKAARQGLRAIALTDHDTVKGLDRAKDEARKQGILFIPGIEIEIERRSSGEFHLLG